MRFLVVSAFLACTAAAPSHLPPPVAVVGVQAVPVTLRAIPTLSPGDIQAAAIDAQVKAQDEAIAAVDKARALSEQVTENLNDKATVGSDLVKSSNEETIWAAQDKQWQALDALKTAVAQLDGVIASNAPALANSAVTGTYLAAIAPISPVVYTPSIIAPVLKFAEPYAEPTKEAKVEENMETLVKSAGQISEENDSITVEAPKKNLDAIHQLVPLVG